MQPKQQLVNEDIAARLNLDAKIEPVVYTRLFLEVMAEEGVQASEVLADTGLSAVDLADPKNSISIAQQIRIYANIAKCSKNPTIGLVQGQRVLPQHHGVWGYAMQTSANLGQALRIFNQYFQVAGPIARQIIQVDGTSARWISQDVVPNEPARRVGLEEMLSGNFNLFRHLTDNRFSLQELRVDYPCPCDKSVYQDLFQCPVLFEQNSIEMRFDASLLNLKLKYADAETERVCEERCQELLKRLGSAGSIVEKVRRIIYESACDRRDVEAVASQLCISPRTLRRHLTQENTSFRAVLNDVRQELAVDYLVSTQLSVDEIAFLLGYSETSSFRHAFKQWTGESPTGYRKDRH